MKDATRKAIEDLDSIRRYMTQIGYGVWDDPQKLLHFGCDCFLTGYRWKKKYGDMELADAKRLKSLEKENAELKKMLAESMLENRVLKEVNAKKW